jgi:hypothetical protein
LRQTAAGSEGEKEGMMTRARLLRRAAAIGLLMLAIPAAAQKIEASQPDTRVSQGTDPGTAELNRQQAERAELERRTNAQNAEVYRRQVEEHDRAVAAANAARLAYEGDLARNAAQNAAYAQQRAAYEAAMERWRADVAACNAGNRSRCGTQRPQ